jgi:hypothetical protein
MKDYQMAAKSKFQAVKIKIRMAPQKSLAKLKNGASQDKTVEQI